MKTKTRSRLRVPLLWLAGIRAVIGIIAIPLAPFLYREHFALLVLLRPTKEVLLAAGFQIRRGDANPVQVLAAAIPLAVFGVWHFYWLGRAWSKEIQEGKGLPRFADRILPHKRIKQLCGVLDKDGEKVVVLGRLAAFPSSLMGAAAGASDMEARRFLPWDGIGALLSVAEVLLAGFILGEAYKKAGPWITALGVVVLLGLLMLFGRYLKKERKR